MRTRTLLFALVLVPAAALAESTDPAPAPTTTPEATPAPAETATPAPPAPLATPAPAAPVATPGWTAVADAIEPEAPAARPWRNRGWELDAAIHSQGLFDGGIHVFSKDSWLTGAELRARRRLMTSDAGVQVTPELAYGLAHEERPYPASASTELWLQRYSAGVRTSVSVERIVPMVHPFVRAGATFLWSTALAHTPYRDHREEAFGYGAYGSLGLEIDLANVVRPIVRPGQELRIGVEAGHLYSPGLDYGRMGTLDVNAMFVSGQLSARF